MVQEPPSHRPCRRGTGRQRRDVTVRVLGGDDRDQAFDQVLTENPGFADYEQKSGRTMPVALLTPR